MDSSMSSPAPQPLPPSPPPKVVASKKLSHSGRKGWCSWLVQRATAVLMVLFILLVVLQWVFSTGDMVYDRWAGIFDNTGMKILTLLAGIAIVAHTWVGMRDIFIDYVKNPTIRVYCYIFTWTWLIACAGWLTYILWRL